MRRFPSSIAPLLLPLAALPALWLFWVVRLPKSVDGVLHLLRVIVFDYYLDHGAISPRWVPLLALGYGYPLFNFYAPGFYALTALLHRLGLGQVDALLLATGLLILLGGCGMYALAADVLSRTATPLRSWAALVAASAYMLTPYLLINAYVRGGFPEIAAQALLPWVFWSTRRLMLGDQPILYTLAVAVSLGGLALSHNILLLLTAPALLAYLLFLTWERGPGRARRLGWAVLALAAAAGLSAFFWLPLIAERRYLSPAAYAVAAAAIDAHTWSWTNALDLSLTYTYTSVTPFRLGLMQILLAAVGFILLQPRPREIVFWAVLLAASLLGISRLALPLWRASDILLVVQYPWRLLSIAALPLALFTAGVVTWRRGPQAAAVALTLALLIFANRPHLRQVMPHLPGTADDDIAVIPQFEAELDALGTSLTSEFVPRWVEALPFSPAPAPALLPPAPQVVVEHADPFTVQMTVTAPAATALDFSSFYFPGWTATLDGAPASLAASEPAGLITVALPAGTHTLLLRWQGTRVQRIGSAASLAAISALTLLLSLGMRGRNRLWALAPLSLLAIWLVARLPPSWPLWQTPANPLRSESVELLGFAAEPSTGRYLLLFPSWLVTGPTEPLTVTWALAEAEGRVVSQVETKPTFGALSAESWPAHSVVDDGYRLALPPNLPAGRYDLLAALDGGDRVKVGAVDLPAVPSQRQPAMDRLDLRFGDHLLLDGSTVAVQSLSPAWRLPDAVRAGRTARPGDRLRLVLYWRADGAVDENVRGFVHLVDAEGQPLVQNDHLPGQLSPPLLWDRFHPQPDIYWLTIPADAPSGLYRPQVGLYRAEDGERLPVRDASGTLLGETHALAPIKIAVFDAPPPDRAVNADVGGFATLLGYSLDAPEPLRPGDLLTVTLVYRSDAATPVDYTQFVHLHDPALGMAAQRDDQPRRGGNPTSSWLEGERIVEEVPLRISPGAAPGTYRLSVGWYDPTSGIRVPIVDARGQPLPDAQVPLAALRVE